MKFLLGENFTILFETIRVFNVLGYGVVPTVPPIAVPPGTSTFQMPPVIVPPVPGAPNPIVGSSTTPTSNSTPGIYQPNPPAAESTNNTSVSL